MNNPLAPYADHLLEYQDWHNRQPDTLKTPAELRDLLTGYLSTFGMRPEVIKRIEFNHKERVMFFPFLDPYWFRAGRVWLPYRDAAETRLSTWRARLAACLREAERRDEVHVLFRPNVGADLRSQLRHFGGICA